LRRAIEPPPGEYARRWEKFQKRLRAHGLDGALLVQAADVIYFTGTFQDGHLYIPAEGKPLFMVRRDYNLARADAAVEDVVPIRSFRQLPELIHEAGHPGPERLGLEFDVLPVATYQYYRKVFPGAEFTDCASLVRELRAVKTPFEITLLRDAGRRMDAVFEALPGILREGRTEVEMAGLFEAVARREGHQGLLRMRGLNAEPFWGHLLTGETALVTSFFDGAVGGPGVGPAFRFGASFKTLNRNEPVVVDYPGIFHGYIVDMTRIFVVGKLPAKLARGHRVALEIQEALAREVRPGWTAAAVYERARTLVAEAGLEAHFMGHANPVRFVGHGVGLELNELPVLAAGLETELVPGMVFALEPKFAFPGAGVVGIENTFLVTSDGLERLTNYPDEVRELP
jgi:Xaa-Pro aminopeptidase